MSCLMFLKIVMGFLRQDRGVRREHAESRRPRLSQILQLPERVQPDWWRGKTENNTKF